MPGQTLAHAIFRCAHPSRTVYDHAVVAHQQHIGTAFHRLTDQRKDTFRPVQLERQHTFPRRLDDALDACAFHIAAQQQPQRRRLRDAAPQLLRGKMHTRPTLIGAQEEIMPAALGVNFQAKGRGVYLDAILHAPALQRVTQLVE